MKNLIKFPVERTRLPKDNSKIDFDSLAEGIKAWIDKTPVSTPVEILKKRIEELDEKSH